MKIWPFKSGRPAALKRSCFTSLPVSRECSSLEALKSKQVSVKTLPAEYNLCPVEDLVILIAYMFSEVIQVNDQRTVESNVHTRFHSRFVP